MMNRVNRVRGLVACAALAGAALAASDASAQKCNSGSNIAKSLFEKYGAVLRSKGCKSSDECMANRDKREAVVRDMVSFWNEQSQNSWATIGPRELVFDSKLDGNIKAAGERLFITKLPADADDVTVSVTKERGEAAAEITLSTFEEGKSCDEKGSVEFAKGDAAGAKIINGHGVRGKILVVKVDSKNLTKQFDYFLTIRKGTARP